MSDVQSGDAGTGQDVRRMELRGFSRTVAEVEWLLVLLVFVFWLFDDQIAYRGAYIGATAVYVVAVLALRFAPYFAQREDSGLLLEAILMTVFIALLSGLSGHLSSPLLNLFLLPIIVAAITLGRRQTLGLVILIFAAVLVLGFSDPLIAEYTAPFIIRVTLLIAPLALIAALTVMLSQDIRTSRIRVRSLLDTDALTGLFNLRAFNRQLRRVHEDATASGGHYSVLMMDLDGLKAINDSHGHDNGNRVLRAVARGITGSLRGQDMPVRYGGDEFVVLLPDADAMQARGVAKRIREAVGQQMVDVGDAVIQPRLSAGVATCPADSTDPSALLGIADGRMYAQKAAAPGHRGRAGSVSGA